MSRDTCVTLDTTQFISPEEFPLNHFRNLTRENKVTTSAAVEVQGSLCCYFFSQGQIWLTALTGHTSLGTTSTGTLICLSHLSFCFSVLHFFSLNTLSTCITQTFQCTTISLSVYLLLPCHSNLPFSLQVSFLPQGKQSFISESCWSFFNRL